MLGLDHSSPVSVIFLMVVLIILIRQFRFFKQHSGNPIRRIPGVDAIESAVGSCAEQGRPVFFTSALTPVGPVLYSCLGILSFVSKKAAAFKLKLFLPQSQSDSMALVEDTVRESYRQVNKSQFFDPQNIRYLSDEQFAFASGYQGMMNRERGGAAFLFGSFAAEALVLAEAGQQVGAKQVAASVSPEQVAFFICTCDYTLIGEELFAASAYMTGDRVEVASIAVQDRIKLILICLILLGSMVATLHNLSSTFMPYTLDSIFTIGW